jgi:pimeloyl-ACP methyl ester carboxylesterase
MGVAPHETLAASAGYKVVAPDLPGHGRDGARWDEVAFEELVSSVCAVLDAQPEPSVLVGHSVGGAVVAQAAEDRPGAIVYLTALVPADGECALESARCGMPEDAAAAGSPPTPRFEQMNAAELEAFFYTGCAPEHIELARYPADAAGALVEVLTRFIET